jgi:branched-chain amino acid transport system substrate-binding protein
MGNVAAEVFGMRSPGVPVRVRGLVATLVGVGLLVAACGTPQDPTAGGDAGTQESGVGNTELKGEPVRIGISMPLSGDFSEPGKGIRRGYEAWAEQVNSSDGLLGRPVELLFRDDASDPNRVVSDYESLIEQEKVDLVFGPFSSRLVIPAAKVAEDYDMLFVEPAGAAPEVFEQGFRRLFYAAPAVADDHYNYLADWILALPADQRPKTAAYASLDDPFAQGTAYGLKQKLEAAGIETVADEVYPPDQLEFANIAARIADKNADIFVGGTQFEDSVGLLRSFQELGYQPRLAAFSTGPTLPEFSEAVGGATDGVISPVGWAPSANYAGNQEFIQLYRETFDSEPNEDAANGYTVGQIVTEAVNEVGCVEPTKACQDKLAAYIRDNEFDTIVGPLDFDAAGRPQSAHMIQQWQGGEVEIVLPDDSEAKTADLQYPKADW